MKALSLWQPWASLMQTGAKTIETRSWSTNYRGPLLICSAKKGLSKADLLEWMNLFPFTDGLYPLVKEELHHRYSSGLLFPEVRDRIIEVLPFGKALCVVDLVGVISTNDIGRHQYGDEKEFGDYSKNRFAWITKNRRPIEPIPITGRQGLFNVPEELQSQFKFIEL